MTVQDRLLDEWLRGLKWSLSAIPSPDREDIVEETRAHISERIEGGASLEEVLDAFGTPDAYARRFVDEMEVAGALSTGRSGSLLGVIARRAQSSLLAVAAVMGLLVLMTAAIAAGVAGFYKLIDPVHTGLWVGDGFAFIGTIDDPATGRELLGNWIYPLVPALLTLCWYLGRLILIETVRTFARR